VRLHDGLTVTAALASLGLLAGCLGYLGRRDYVAAVILAATGVAMMHVAARMARTRMADAE
jgi:hypothetical protein